ncbi:DUF6318 family protein [Brachybacterium paraconglomeratum]|uniref:DUF6318 family protein n=1 Tax=Brachybacterium paraconglomeratum TaxID=173362 RepID=UPI00026C6B88|nr:DUF6318 family protein [Brachybacterium paraconglomeratum]
MSRRLLAAVAAAALTVGLAACGEGEGGTVTTPPPSIDTGQDDGASDAGGEEPSDAGGGDGAAEAAPDIPAPDPADFPGMDEQTPEGAEQAFKYFWAVAMSGYQGADAAELSRMSDPNCGNCTELLSEIDDLQETGDVWSRVDISDVSLGSEEGTGGYDAIVDYVFILPAHEEPGAGDQDGASVEESEFATSGGLVWDGGSWKVVDFSAGPRESDSE